MLEYLKIITIFLHLDFAQMDWHTTEWNGGVKIKQKDGGFAFVLRPGAQINAVQTNRPAVRVGDIITVTYTVKKLGHKPPRFVSLDPAPAPPGKEVGCDCVRTTETAASGWRKKFGFG
jgi:hypothetical protein